MLQVYCFLSNRTGDIRFNTPIFMEQAQLEDNIFSTRGNTFQASDLETRAETHNFPWRKIKIKITKCERCTVETSMNNSFARERVFCHFNERLCQTEPEIYFLTKSSERLHVIIIISQVTCQQHFPKHKTFEVKNN